MTEALQYIEGLKVENDSVHFTFSQIMPFAH